MSVPTENIDITAGDTFILDLTYTESDSVTARDLTGATARCQFRTTAISGTIEATLTGGITDAPNGIMQFSLTGAETQALLVSTEASAVLVYDVDVTFSDTTVATLVKGNVALTQGVTR